jgi:hypothetical protein
VRGDPLTERLLVIISDSNITVMTGWLSICNDLLMDDLEVRITATI